MSQDTFNIGSISAQRDVNIKSKVSNINKILMDLEKECSEEDKVKLQQLQKAISEKNGSKLSSIIDSISDNIPLVISLCKALCKTFI